MEYFTAAAASTTTAKLHSVTDDIFDSQREISNRILDRILVVTDTAALYNGQSRCVVLTVLRLVDVLGFMTGRVQHESANQMRAGPCQCTAVVCTAMHGSLIARLEVQCI